VQVLMDEPLVLVSPKWRQYLHVSNALCLRRLGVTFHEVNAAPTPSKLRLLSFAQHAPDAERWIRV
jgi:hypothetical protein